MKTMVRFGLVMVLAASAASISAQGYGSGTGGGRGQGGNGQGLGGGQEDDLIALVKDLPKETLSSAEAASLLAMREEEKLARDVYAALAKKWNIPVFGNIAQSEQTHMDALKFLVDRYRLADPVSPAAGEFNSPTLKKLYTDLVARGSRSLQEAFAVGAEVEDLDIADLEKALKSIDNRDLGVLYQNLAKGSRNHLRSYVGQLERAGGKYTAQHISQEYLDYTLRLNRETTPITDPKYVFRRG